MTEPGLVEPDQLFLIADGGSDVHLYRIGADLRPIKLGAADSPRHGRGSLGHGYTPACDPTGEQCNNSQCRAKLNHDRCTPACSGETYWDDLGPWQIAPARRDAFLASLRNTWNCQAYGQGGAAVDALCFFAEPGSRSCGTQDECHTRLVGERVRVFERIQELAAGGDPAGQYLAAEFTHPEQLLGGGSPPHGIDPGTSIRD